MSRPHAAVRRTVIAAAVTLLAAGLGCAHRQAAVKAVPPLDVQGSAMFGTFVKQNTAVLKTPSPVSAMYTVGDAVYVYTADNHVYVLSDGLDVRYIVSPAPETEHVRAPVVVKNEVIFPTSVGLSVFSPAGEPIRSVSLPNPITSDVATDSVGHVIAGSAMPSGGTVAVIDPTKLVLPVTNRAMIGGVQSKPAVQQGTIFAATDAGGVYAIDAREVPARSVWALPNMRFQTDGSVTADLVADDYAVYVASTDTKLYALDRATGKIKWRYQAQVPLREAPLVTAKTVYQVVPGRGLVALSKTEAAEFKEPTWTAPRITKVLSVDDKYVYGVLGRDRVVALGIDDGKVKFSVAGQFDYFVAGPDATIFAATNNGAVVSFKRGAYSGNDVAAR